MEKKTMVSALCKTGSSSEFPRFHARHWSVDVSITEVRSCQTLDDDVAVDVFPCSFVVSNAQISSPDGYPALSPLFSTIELLIPLGAEFNALSPHKL